jgi:hypothetical protein
MILKPSRNVEILLKRTKEKGTEKINKHSERYE